MNPIQQKITVQIYIWICTFFSLFFFGCSSFIQDNLNEYPKEKLEQIENQKWQIEGKISFNHLKDSRQNFVGSFVWQSDQGEFNVNFYNQISDQSLVVMGDYFNAPIQLMRASQEIELDSLNQVLQQFFGLNLNWQDLIFWLAYQIPSSARDIQLNSEDEIVSFEYQNLKVQYLSFFNQKIKNKNLLPLKKVKLFNIIQFDSENKKISQLKIALRKFDFQFH